MWANVGKNRIKSKYSSGRGTVSASKKLFWIYRPKHIRKRIHQAKKNFLEKFKTASKMGLNFFFNSSQSAHDKFRTVSGFSLRTFPFTYIGIRKHTLGWGRCPAKFSLVNFRYVCLTDWRKRGKKRSFNVWYRLEVFFLAYKRIKSGRGGLLTQSPLPLKLQLFTKVWSLTELFWIYRPNYTWKQYIKTR